MIHPLSQIPIDPVEAITSQMAQLTKAATPDHRKLAFSSIGGNHIASWPTPPTEHDNDFSQDNNTIMLPSVKEQDFGRTALHSPPASPVQQVWSDKLPPIQSPSEASVQTPLPHISDQQLFSEPSDNNLPLFPAEERTDSLSPAGRRSPAPKKASFNSLYSIFPQFQGADREFFRKYRQSCYQDVVRIPGWRPINAAAAESSPSAMTHMDSRPAYTERSFRVTKPRETQVRAKPLQSKAKIPRVSTAASPVAKSINKTPSMAAAAKRERQSASAEPQARKRAPPSKPVVVDNWKEISDYSPPTATLDAMPLRLRVHWKGVPNDLSKDPEISYLHPQEVEIAQELKLPANQYLANKRRIFEARLKSIREHKNFTKTAAQQACNIDVNKTSQLYEAYEKVGWFDESNFKQWLV